FDLQRAVAIGHFGALAAARGERHHLVRWKAALFEDVEHFPAHIARGADDCNLETHGISPVPLRSFSGEARRPCGPRLPGPNPGEGEQAKGDQTVLAVVLAVVLVMRDDAIARPAQWLVPGFPRKFPSRPGQSNAKSAINRPRIVRNPVRGGFYRESENSQSKPVLPPPSGPGRHRDLIWMGHGPALACVKGGSRWRNPWPS